MKHAPYLVIASLMAILVLTGCHTTSQQQPHFTNAPVLLTGINPGADQIDRHQAAAQALLEKLQQDAASHTESERPDPSTHPLPGAVLPPLPVKTHLSLSAFFSHGGGFLGETFRSDPDETTPILPSVFSESDEFGHALNLDMGLTELNLPDVGVMEWPLFLHAYCNCQGTAGLYQSDVAQARLDFGSGQFRLSASFSEPDLNLRTVGMNTELNQASLIASKSQTANTELIFTDSSRTIVPGQLDLFFSGRAARHMGGQFITQLQDNPAPDNLADILFAMQFASTSP